jgi:hypothetical protein
MFQVTIIVKQGPEGRVSGRPDVEMDARVTCVEDARRIFNAALHTAGVPFKEDNDA